MCAVHVFRYLAPLALLGVPQKTFGTHKKVFFFFSVPPSSYPSSSLLIFSSIQYAYKKKYIYIHVLGWVGKRIEVSDGGGTLKKK